MNEQQFKFSLKYKSTFEFILKIRGQQYFFAKYAFDHDQGRGTTTKTFYSKFMFDQPSKTCG